MTTVLQEKILKEGPRTLDARLRARFPGCRVRTMRDPMTGRQETDIGWHAGHDQVEMRAFADAYVLGTADAAGAIDPAAGMELKGTELARKDDTRRAPERKTDPKARQRLDELFGGSER